MGEHSTVNSRKAAACSADSDHPDTDANWHVTLGDSSEVTPPGYMLMLTDPPFGTGKTQTQQGCSYRDPADTDTTLNILNGWGQQVAADGTVAVICDYRMLNGVLDSLDFLEFRGEIIWTFGLGRPRTSWWPNRHNHILTFTRTATSGIFDPEAVPREIRKAPKPGYPSTKPSGSVWDTTMGNTDPERVGYPSQKPLRILRPFVLAHTNQFDLVVDPFAGSGSTGVAAVSENRAFFGIDSNPEAVDIATRRINKL